MIVQALAPAKINLGLEVLGQRSDGFHEIRTIMAAVSLFDRISVTTSSLPAFHVDNPELGGEPNLVERAIDLIGEIEERVSGRVTLQKRIPTAAGLGGASSDAAAALIALNRCYKLELGTQELLTMAFHLGSDVPFFIGGGRALVSGRGEVIHPLPPLRSIYAVIVAPVFRIQSKTATLYRSLKPSDFSDGSRIEQSARAEIDRFATEGSALRNAFERPLYEIAPELKSIPEILSNSGATVVALSGAGPAHYALERDLERARAIADRVREELPQAAHVHVVRLISRGVTSVVCGRLPDNMLR